MARNNMDAKLAKEILREVKKADGKQAFDIAPQAYDFCYQYIVRGTGLSTDYLDEQKVRETHRVLSKRPGFPAAPSILDYGCGPGNAGPWLRKYFPDSPIYGVDISAKSVRIAKEKNEAINISYAAIDERGGDFPFDMQFDLIVVYNTFHHIAKREQPQVFLRIKALLNNGGLLVIHEMNPYNPVIAWVFHKYDTKNDPAANILHPRYLRKQIAKAGLGVTRPYYELFFPGFLSALLPLEKHMTRVPFGARYYVIAEHRGNSS